MFYRAPISVDENLFVNTSSPSSSRYADVAALGTPQAAADATLAQYLTELMSTRLGVRREGRVVSAAARTAPDGREYYDVVARSRSGPVWGGNLGAARRGRGWGWAGSGRGPGLRHVGGCACTTRPNSPPFPFSSCA